MIIHGFQKLTLLDFPTKTACTVFTGRPVICVVPSAITRDLSSLRESTRWCRTDEVFALLEKRKNTIDGVCITGGEPMLMKDLPEFAAKLKERGVAVKIDTNGTFPRELKYIVRNGLADYIAMDIKNCFKKYPETVGRPDFDTAPVRESIDFLKSCGIGHEFRTTVCRNFHTEEDLIKIAHCLGAGENYFLQNFKDSGELISGGISGYTPSEMEALVSAVKKIIPGASLRGV